MALFNRIEYGKESRKVEGISKEEAEEIICNLNTREIAKLLYDNMNNAFSRIEVQLNLENGEIGVARYFQGSSDQVKDYIVILAINPNNYDLNEILDNYYDPIATELVNEIIEKREQFYEQGLSEDEIEWMIIDKSNDLRRNDPLKSEEVCLDAIEERCKVDLWFVRSQLEYAYEGCENESDN